MKIAYFDCFSGISGDMVLGALVDAGLDPALLQAELDKLELPGLSLGFERTSRQAIAATLAQVQVGGDAIAPSQEHHFELVQESDHDHGHTHDHAHPHPHRAPLAPLHAAPPAHHHHGPGEEHEHHHLGAILDRIRNSRLDAEVKQSACRIFERLAEAEAQVHGLPPAQVHLHEVGALDAVADIVGAVAGLRLLGVEKVYSSALRDGTGFVRCAHGRYPVPVPGVLALCRDIPFEQTEIRAELVTPTGAAIITTLASAWGPAPPFRLERVGYGAGRRQLEEIPNVLRIRIGHTTQAFQQERAVLVEANIDDMNPEVYGYLSERLLEQGVRDVYLTPVQMKKGRPGTLLSVLAGEEQVDLVVELLLAETTTLGVRFHPVERRKLERGSLTVETGYGPVRVKVGHLGQRRRYAPEYEDCARLARQHQVPLLQIYEAARAQEGEGLLAEMGSLLQLPAGEGGKRFALGDVHGFVHVYEQRESGGYAELWVSDYFEGGISGLFLADADADGKEELIAYTDQGRFLYLDPQTYKTIWSNPPHEYQRISGMLVRNIDEDPALELIFCGDGRLVIYDGKDHFEEWRSTQTGLGSAQILVADVDGDGAEEIVLNEGYVFDARFHDLEWQSPEPFGERLGLRDVDEDGMPEVIGEFQGRFLRIFDIDLRREKSARR